MIKTFKPATRAQIVATARSWLGTPYHHQARCKGVGVDCAGLIVGIAKELQLSNFDFTNYGRLPLGDKLHAIMGSQTLPLHPDTPWQVGQICLMRFDTEPQHLGIIGSNPHPSGELGLNPLPSGELGLNPLPSGEGRVRVGALNQSINIAQPLTLIHAYGSAGAVVEHRLAQVWQARIIARFDYIGVL